MQHRPTPKESDQVWDERDLNWKLAYQTALRRLETFQFLKDVLFNTTGETYTSEAFECAPFKDFLLLIDLDVTLAPTDITISVQFSHDGVRWFNYMDGPFGSLVYEDAAGDKTECISGKVIAHWMRIYVVSSGCTSSATFNLSVIGELSG